MKSVFLLVGAMLLLTVCVSAQQTTPESVYTDLAPEKCKTLELNESEAGSYVGECPGAGDYKLELLEGDLRQTINVVAPNGKKYSLNLWTIVSTGFSSMGDKAEWRAARQNGKLRPTALIVRFNASENPEDASKITSYLVVSKITASDVCVTDIIKPSPDANARARTAADSAAGKPCRAIE